MIIKLKKNQIFKKFGNFDLPVTEICTSRDTIYLRMKQMPAGFKNCRLIRLNSSGVSLLLTKLIPPLFSLQKPGFLNFFQNFY